MKTVFAADMHLQPGDHPDQQANLDRFMNGISGADRLILLGDTFQCFFERRSRVIGNFRPVLSRFAVAKTQGLKILHVTGNRDFGVGAGSRYTGFLKDSFPSVLTGAGIEPCGPRYSFRQSGITVYAMHGDTLCTRDHRYQCFRRILHGYLANMVGHLAPLALIGLWVKSVQHTPPTREYLQPPEHKDITEEAVACELESGADIVVCGHVHHPVTRTISTLNRTGTLHIVPPWLVCGEYAVLENSTYRVVGQSGEAGITGADCE